jgi:UDP-N-acetyl-2-amino-2-deoxyglucuronate dehydrogenase
MIRLGLLGLGLLGCGRIAKRQSELLGGNHIDRASVVAVFDPIRARANAIAPNFRRSRLRLLALRG